MKRSKVYIRSIFDQVFASPRCLLCHHSSQRSMPLCSGCEKDLPWLNSYCQHCAEPLPESLSVPTAESSAQSSKPLLTCGHCLKHPPAFTRTYAPLRYEFPIDLLIRRFKHRPEHHCIELLGDLFVQHLAQAMLQQTASQLQSTPQQLIPVPLHRNRLQQRGFNQSLELAHCISQRLGIPVNDKACSRQLDTPHQQGLSAKQRRRNLRHAFGVNRDQLDRTGPCQHVALIDDVMTTGTTAQILAVQLRRAGVERVDIWCLARTPAGRLSTSSLQHQK